MISRCNFIVLLMGVAVFSWVLSRYTASSGKQATIDTPFSMELISHPNPYARCSYASAIEKPAAAIDPALYRQRREATV